MDRKQTPIEIPSPFEMKVAVQQAIRASVPTIREALTKYMDEYMSENEDKNVEIVTFEIEAIEVKFKVIDAFTTVFLNVAAESSLLCH
jgi:hypothetical protein